MIAHGLILVDEHAVADLQILHVFTDLHDFTDGLVPKFLVDPDAAFRTMLLKGKDVGSTDAREHVPDNGLVIATLRVGHVDDIHIAYAAKDGSLIRIRMHDLVSF